MSGTFDTKPLVGWITATATILSATHPVETPKSGWRFTRL
jgi:hypothetical protein